MISTVKFEHGEKTCSVSKGTSCIFMKVTGFAGTRQICSLYSQELTDAGSPEGWIKRCPQCLIDFNEETK